MTTNTHDTASPRSYTLRCVDCSFERRVEDDVFGVLDVVDRHREEHAADPADHFVEFETDAAAVRTSEADD